MILTVFQFLAGLSILIGGSHLLVISTADIAYRLKKKVFFIALFLLGCGTSAPELFITIQSHLNQEPDMALGNIVGSNIFNILAVGAFILLSPAYIQNQKTIIKSAGLLLITTLSAGLFLLDFSLSWWNGLVFLALFSFFFKESQGSDSLPEEGKKTYPVWMSLAFLTVGFILLFLGAQITLSSSAQLGAALGLSKRIVGLLLLSIGTSLPELAVAAAALIKKHSEMALGGIIGSNAFNTFFIPGIASLWANLPVSKDILVLDSPIMILSELILLLVLLGLKKIPRWGASMFFLLGYTAYVICVLSYRV